MELSKAIGAALKEVREAKALTQEDFVGVSGRTYLSEIERGLKSPTLEKLDQLATHMGIHPLELLVACYAKRDSVTTEDVLGLLHGRLLQSFDNHARHNSNGNSNGQGSQADGS